MVLPLDSVRFVRGADLLTTFRLPGAKHFFNVFCKVCGAPMARLDQGRSIAIVPMGALDDDPGVRAERHIHADSRAAWDEIGDDLPRYAGPPPSL
jgi:hypothetical protein